MSDADSYTLGPWVIYNGVSPDGKSFPEGTVIISRPTGKRIADICWLNSSNANNARLICAAPDMLALLRWMDHRGCLGRHVHDRITAVIAKAEKESDMTAIGAMEARQAGPANYSAAEVAGMVNSWARTVAAKDAEIRNLNECFSALRLVVALYDDDNTRAAFALPGRKIVLDPPWVRQARAAIANVEGHTHADKP